MLLWKRGERMEHEGEGDREIVEYGIKERGESGT
jgi:hypothetical protein